MLSIRSSSATATNSSQTTQQAQSRLVIPDDILANLKRFAAGKDSTHVMSIIKHHMNATVFPELDLTQVEQGSLDKINMMIAIVRWRAVRQGIPDGLENCMDLVKEYQKDALSLAVHKFLDETRKKLADQQFAYLDFLEEFREAFEQQYQHHENEKLTRSLAFTNTEFATTKILDVAPLLIAFLTHFEYKHNELDALVKEPNIKAPSKKAPTRIRQSLRSLQGLFKNNATTAQQSQPQQNAAVPTESYSSIDLFLANYPQFKNVVDDFTQKFSDALHGVEGLIYEPVIGDGCGLLQAVARNLGKNVNGLSTEIVVEMKKMLDTADSVTGASLRKHIADLESGKERGDELEIDIMQRLSKRPVLVFSSDRALTLPNLAVYTGDPIFIYDNRNGHFDKFALPAGVNAKDVLTKLQARIGLGEKITYQVDPYPEFIDTILGKKRNGVRENGLMQNQLAELQALLHANQRIKAFLISSVESLKPAAKAFVESLGNTDNYRALDHINRKKLFALIETMKKELNAALDEKEVSKDNRKMNVEFAKAISDCITKLKQGIAMTVQELSDEKLKDSPGLTLVAASALRKTANSLQADLDDVFNQISKNKNPNTGLLERFRTALSEFYCGLSAVTSEAELYKNIYGMNKTAMPAPAVVRELRL